ncbi:hypothetical protein PPMP20_04680 [Paraburkholderia phymatum]|uniref:hypothetical protein n=1 Tax=Paraburkholderia phymatum TaxID=148447 RepID=UPI0002F95331|nr:hypothetical protein [Paraburkholderia phymatum]
MNDKTNDKRPRIVPPWLIYTLAGVVVVTMYGVSPSGGLRQRVASVGAPNELSVAYLEAWSRVRPDNEEFLSLLGAQYLYLGRTDDAERIAARMETLGTDDMLRSAMMLHLSVTEQRTFAIPEDDPRRASALEDLRARLTQASKLPWAPRDLEWLAQRCAAVGMPDLAAHLYARLSANDPDGRDKWDTQITRYALQVGDYRAAADAWFRQQATAQTRDEQRRCFVAGIRTLQSGNLLNEALTAADAHLGPLADDPATLVAMLNLARAANRPDAVDRYAKLLAKYALAEPGLPPGEQLRAAAQATYAYMDGPVAYRRLDAHGRLRDATRVSAERKQGSVRVFRVATAVSVPQATSGAAGLDDATRAALRSDPSVAGVVFQAFVESGDLASAQKVAVQQVQRDPRAVDWVKRVAQVAEWNRDPSLALKSWLDYAQLSNDQVGWQNVLRIAPMLDDDEAYLTALVHEARATPNDLTLIDSVTATYERLGRPDDGLAFLR